ncbi:MULTISPECIES: hypothetical protein [unclassified Rathayibacter]|jgi:hypothetical protein|uniref:hypothetical protein n=1 Tax=unclassified Rathayibacter TaxID=2609250 RepID=UPI0015E37E48|nr:MULTISPECIES: hypothetical protein [unclassified Rathayibacter]
MSSSANEWPDVHHTLIGSLTSGSVGATAAVAFGVAAVTAGLVLLGIRLTTPAR